MKPARERNRKPSCEARESLPFRAVSSQNRFDVVVVPFPFTDSSSTKRRPTLIISEPGAFNTQMQMSVMAMITTATALIVRSIGHLAEVDEDEVLKSIGKLVGLDAGV